LGGLVKAGEEFDWERISFVLEATGFQLMEIDSS
jgi:hypothetical protein